MTTNSKIVNKKERITTALLLAAGTGSRLFPLTENSPKCLTLVNEKSILERLVAGLKKQGFKRLVIVTGHQEHCIRELLGTKSESMTIEYIHSPLYKTTNNIYSLWLARNMINEPFLLVESDLVFDASLLDDMVFPDRIAVARMQPWMNGTTVTISKSQQVTGFQDGDTTRLDEPTYKTVNSYSFSLSAWRDIVKRLNHYISNGNVNCYYEKIFTEMVEEGKLSLQAVSFDSKPWYEIDTLADLVEAEKLSYTENVKSSINVMPLTPVISDPISKENGTREATKIAGGFTGRDPLSHPLVSKQ